MVRLLPCGQGLPVAELGIIRKERYGGWFEIRQCSRILSNVDFFELHVRHLEFEQDLADSRAIESSHLLSKQPEARLKADPIPHYLRCLREVDKGIFGLTLSLRHAEIMQHFQRSFREVMQFFDAKETPKAYLQMTHVPQCVAYMNFPHGFTSEQVVKEQHSCYGTLYHRYCTSSAYPQHLLKSVKHYNDRHVEQSI